MNKIGKRIDRREKGGTDVVGRKKEKKNRRMKILEGEPIR
jgi:hypothetical protein